MRPTGGSLVLALMVVLGASVLEACTNDQEPTPSPASPSAAAKVSGTVTYLNDVALPSNARVEVSLQDVSSTDLGTVSTTTISTMGKDKPFAWSIVYDPADVEAGGTYTVTARILVAGRALYRTPQPTQVITQGNPTSGIELVLQQT